MFTLGARGFFFSLGATELSGEEASRKAARKKTRRQAPLALALLAAGEREDLWHLG